jgi:indolepyruvate ferredoxin oxidoreductase, beta subunit
MAYNILHCGFGGQGVVLMANTVGLACALSGTRVNSGELHGLSQRSGSVIAHQRIGDDVLSPLIPYGEGDVILALEPMEAVRYAAFLKKGGLAVVNSNMVHPPIETQKLIGKEVEAYVTYEKIDILLREAGFRVLGIDALGMARDSGNALAENTVMVGALSSMPGFPVGRDFMIEAVKKTVPSKALEANLKAFDLGYDSGDGLLQKL